MNEGGEGNLNPCEETRRKLSVAMARPGHQAILREINSRPETPQKVGEAVRAALATPVARERLSKNSLESQNRPEVIDKKRRAMKGRKAHPNTAAALIVSNRRRKGQDPWNKGRTDSQVAWNKGLKQPCTNERRLKMNRPISAESRAKRLGRAPWNKGLKGYNIVRLQAPRTSSADQT